jgi:hypothetical protein
MVTLETPGMIDQTLPETTEAPHFEKTSCRMKKKFLVAYDGSNNRACVKHLEIDQHVFSSSQGNAIFSMENTWGKQRMDVH